MATQLGTADFTELLDPSGSACPTTPPRASWAVPTSSLPAATLERIRPLLPKMGITRVAEVTGLDRRHPDCLRRAPGRLQPLRLPGQGHHQGGGDGLGHRRRDSRGDLDTFDDPAGRWMIDKCVNGGVELAGWDLTPPDGVLCDRRSRRSTLPAGTRLGLGRQNVLDRGVWPIS